MPIKSKVWLYMPVIPALGRLRWEDCKFQQSYVAIPYLKNPEREGGGKRREKEKKKERC
jgi:hypothetical protein